MMGSGICWRALGVVVVLGCAGVLNAEGPASSSAAPGASLPADFAGNDWTTPARAVASFYVAMAKADGMGISQSAVWGDRDDGRRIADGMVWVSSDKKLRELYAAMSEAFPQDKDVERYVKKNVGDLDMAAKRVAEELARTFKAIDEGKVKLEGEIAVVTPRGREPHKLKRVDGQWKILPESLESPYAHIDEEMRKEMSKQAAAGAKLREARLKAYDGFILELRKKTYASGAVAIEARTFMELEIARKVAEEK